ncbi:MAG: T9SS type A sorting domain-containing protein [Saprospirales bacterium]|nr:T9SS type A sorting domain-containing protein [Saprospirales bacterium]MBK8920594.1 T9SS type A sorting domain-containing protein [Saprospirales bacterium]
MKKRLLPAAACFFFIALFVFGLTLSAAAQIYVKHDATGANTGASWADAYTDLKTALATATDGAEIWVAGGTYRPAGLNGDPKSFFLINKNLRLLGGFAGTETSANQRDPLANATIISGDLNGNDVPDDFTTNRSDNVNVVVKILASITNATAIDGFTLSGGHADGADRFGAAVNTIGAPVIRNCIFTQNYAANSGAGIYFSNATAGGATVENCRFIQNRAEDWTGGGGIYVRNVRGAGVTVSQSEFRSNTGGRGCGLSSYDSNVKVSGTTFTGNINQQQGGALWFWCQGYANLSLQVDHCTFEGNRASFGGALYFIAAQGTQAPSMKLSNCTFKNNSVVYNLPGWDQGGGSICMYVSESVGNTTIAMDSCRFEGNSSTQNGGAVEFYNNGISTAIGITNCLFSQNIARYNGSALMTTLAGKEVALELRNSLFFENRADSASAAVDYWGTGGATGTAVIDNCIFNGNKSWWSGAVEIGNGWNGGASIAFSLTNSIFTNNEAQDGGAVGLWCTENSEAGIIVEHCTFENNRGLSSAGAVSLFPLCEGFDVLLRRCKIRQNESPEGGAISSGPYNFSDGNFLELPNIRIENTLIAGNSSAGPVLYLDSIANLHLINCTVAQNTGGGVALSNRSGLTLQNTILYNPGYAEYAALTPDVSFSSHGGNLIGDISLDGQLLATDRQNLDPLFLGAGDYHIGPGSPCIDMGVNTGNLPALDLDGNARVFGTAVDMGAYESGFTPVREAVAGEVRVSPNPATAFLNLQLPEAVAGQFDVEVFDAQGKLAFRRTLGAGQQLDVQGLKAGVYALKVVAAERVYAGWFVKQ